MVVDGRLVDFGLGDEWLRIAAVQIDP
jgi:hypothetical protein